MPGTRERIYRAFAHEGPDRTPIAEDIWQAGVEWAVAGRTVATDEGMRWDALAEGMSWEELVEEQAQAAFQISKFFGFDWFRVAENVPRDFPRPEKSGPDTWNLEGVEYVLEPQTRSVRMANPCKPISYSTRVSEEETIRMIEGWGGEVTDTPEERFAVFHRVRELASADGQDWPYVGEAGAGTSVAFYPPFMLMWMLCEPGLYRRWLEIQKTMGFHRTEELLSQGCQIIAMGGDVGCNRGTFISPALYHEFILPVIQEHVALIHSHGALAVYTSCGNHWDIKEDFFFNSNIDGYKEVDKASGMTFERMIEEGVDRKVCIIGNVDARHALCRGTVEKVRRETIDCLRLGQQSPGGHILHSSHSIHEDVKIENYFAMVAAYRDYFGLEPPPR